MSSHQASIEQPVLQQQEQGVLRDVLDELDRERTRRAELEAEVRKLKDKEKNLRHTLAASAQEQESSKNVHVSKRELIAMRTERDGFKELIDALTADNDAVSVAMNSREKTLPLQMVRMLEIMPYDPRAVMGAKVEEEVYEWQVYKGGKWTGLLWNFPPAFRKLPVVQPNHGALVEDSTSRRLFPELPPKQTVLTDEKVTKIIKIDQGFSLPNDGGTWAWVSGWRVDKHVGAEDEWNKRQIDCDEEGWSYAEAIEHFVNSPTELCWESADISNDVAQRPYRRRRWTRQRVLLSYPRASQTSLHFLRILAENARLSVIVTKLTDQLVDTKHKLTEAESVIISTKEQFAKEIELMKREIKLRDETILRLPREGGDNGDRTPSKPKGNDLRLDQQFDKVRNAAGSWVSSASNVANNAFRKTPVQEQAPNSPTGGDAENKDYVSTQTENAAFDWRRLGISITPKSKGLLLGLSARKLEAIEKEIEPKTVVAGERTDEERATHRSKKADENTAGDDGVDKATTTKEKDPDSRVPNGVAKADDEDNSQCESRTTNTSHLEPQIIMDAV